MKTLMRIIPVSGPIEDREIELAAEPNYDMLSVLIRPFLGGNHFEHVTVLFEEKRRDMFVDETGALDGLPQNEIASVIYRANWLKMHPKQDPESLPPIYGVAVLFPNRQVWF